jgi:hypothetical protein
MSFFPREIGEARRAGFTVPDLSRLRHCLPFVLVLAAAILLRSYVDPNVDVAWCLTVAEKMLEGQRLYVDIIDLNPPLYLPPVAVARLFGLRPETVTDIFVFAGACASIWFAGRVFDCRRYLGVDGWHLATVTLAVFTVLPAFTFGNRDPVGMMALLPWLAVCALRAMRRPVALEHALIGGLGAGLAVIIKPHFVLALLLAAVVAAVCAKSWRVLLALENRVAAGLVLAYGVVLATVFPAFLTDMLPMIADVYVARPMPVPNMMPGLVLWLVMIGMILELRRRSTFDPPFCVLVAASCGCVLAFLAQGKGWAYHSVPMLSFALLALVIAGNWLALPQASAGSGKRGRPFRNVLVGVLVAACFLWNNRAGDVSDVAAKVREVSPHPTMLAITSDISLGHPLVRQVGGVWVGRVCSNWITLGVLLRRRSETLDAATAARLDAYEALDRAWLREDIAKSRPDIILVEKVSFDWEAWARSDPALREQLDAYREVDTMRGIMILQRRS